MGTLIRPLQIEMAYAAAYKKDRIFPVFFVEYFIAESEPEAPLLASGGLGSKTNLTISALPAQRPRLLSAVVRVLSYL